MKRDWEIIRDVLSDVENENIEDRVNSLPEDEQEVYLRHLELLVDCGYINGVEIDFRRGGYTLDFDFPRLSMDGYDFKDVLQDNKIWNKIKQKAKDNFVKLSWVFIKEAIPLAIKEVIK